MSVHLDTPAVAFVGQRLIAKGALKAVMPAILRAVDAADLQSVLVFHGETSRPIDLDLRGDPGTVLERLPTGPESTPRPKGPGRPRLGVVSKEVTLLPRHWRWLGEQPGGASPTLRKLVERAMRGPADRLRQAREACDRFMLAMAGNQPGYEEATRALYRGQRDRFEAQVLEWPEGIRDHVLELAGRAFTAGDEAGGSSCRT